MSRAYFKQYMRSLETGGLPTFDDDKKVIVEENQPEVIVEDDEKEKANVYGEVPSTKELVSGYVDYAGSSQNASFPRMSEENTDGNTPNLNIGKNGFLSLAMARHYGYTGEIRMTSGQRLGYDQWRVMREYQKNDMHLYNRQLQKVVSDSTKTHGWNSQEAEEKIVDWLDLQYEKYQRGELTEKELRRLTGSHVISKAGDFTGSFRNWLASSKSKKFRKDFNIKVLDESDHFHVTFNDFDQSKLTLENRSHLGMYDQLFNRLSIKQDGENESGQTVINMNPSVYSMKELTNALLPLPVQTPTLMPTVPERKLHRAAPYPIYKEQKKNFWGKKIPRPEDELPLNQDEIDAYWSEQYIRTSTGDQGFTKSTYENGGNPSFSWPPSEQDLDPNYKPPIIQDDVTKVTVNDNGWADIDAYRDKKEDGQFILNTQNFLIDKGFEIKNDALWGNQTYNALNQYLVNKQLDNYTYTNFSEDQFLNQIYKESAGRNTTVSSAGAMGIAQFKPDTFEWAKEKGWIPTTAKITDRAAQSLAQRKYMDYLYEDRTNIKSGKTKSEKQARAFAAYNMGPGKFDKFWKTLTDAEKKAGYGTWYKKLNNETRNYVLWNMDKTTLETNYKTTFDKANWRFAEWMKSKPTYRYAFGGPPTDPVKKKSSESTTSSEGFESAFRKKIGHTKYDMDMSHAATIDLIKSQDWKHFRNAWPTLSEEDKKEIKDHWEWDATNFDDYGTNLTDAEKFGYYEAHNRYYDKFNHAINMFNLTKNQGSTLAQIGAWGHEATNLWDGMFGTNNSITTTSGDSGTDMRNNYLGINAAKSGMSYHDFLKSLVEEGVYEEQHQGSVFDRGWSDLTTDWFGEHEGEFLDK